MDSDWLTFEQAGRLIDGPDGWSRNDAGGRPSALTLLMLARGGSIATNAQAWSVRRRATYDNGLVPCEEPPFDADPESRADFFRMLFAREKLSSDAFHAKIGPGIIAQVAFSLADDRAGTFEAASVLTLPQSKVTTWHSVVGLRFRRTDVEAAFGCRKKARSASSTALPHGLPSLSPSQLRDWWNELPEETKGQPIDRVLVPLCRSAFPNHGISRDRIRALAPGRKRGPKPFRDKLTA